MKSSLLHQAIETNTLTFSAFSQILTDVLNSTLLQLVVITNALKLSGYVFKIFFSRVFKYFGKYALISSACSHILHLLLILSLLYQVIKKSALILRALSQILTVLLKFSLLHLVVERSVLKFRGYVFKIVFSRFFVYVGNMH